VTVNLTSTENGTGYVLVSATSATLTAQDVITRVNADAANDFVATPTLTADMAATANITGLQATTQYFVYAVATDASANPSIVRTTSFTTTVATDTTAPTLNPAPTVTATSDTTATVSLTSNEAGTGYILITARDAASTLDNAAIIARVNAPVSGDVATTTAITIPGTATTTNITGLTASTTYTAYIVAADNATTPNNSTVATVDFATEAVADVTAPMISSFTVTALSLNEVQVEVVNNEDGDLSVIILPAADTTPIPSAVTTPGPNTISLSAAVTERMSTHTVTGLASNTRYAAYAVLTDASGNPSAIAAIADVNAFATTNAPPVANAGSVSTVLVGGTATLNGRGSTDDGAITTYAWAQTTTPTGVTGTLTGADTD
ncbi:MAG: hypothetical protein K8963_07065, partial [Proteobacteria bacterium]|nr:hypothetical protein [Pseudomonadota bacterium]